MEKDLPEIPQQNVQNVQNVTLKSNSLSNIIPARNGSLLSGNFLDGGSANIEKKHGFLSKMSFGRRDFPPVPPRRTVKTSNKVTSSNSQINLHSRHSTQLDHSVSSTSLPSSPLKPNQQALNAPIPQATAGYLQNFYRLEDSNELTPWQYDSEDDTPLAALGIQPIGQGLADQKRPYTPQSTHSLDDFVKTPKLHIRPSEHVSLSESISQELSSMFLPSVDRPKRVESKSLVTPERTPATSVSKPFINFEPLSSSVTTLKAESSNTDAESEPPAVALHIANPSVDDVPSSPEFPSHKTVNPHINLIDRMKSALNDRKSSLVESMMDWRSFNQPNLRASRKKSSKNRASRRISSQINKVKWSDYVVLFAINPPKPKAQLSTVDDADSIARQLILSLADRTVEACSLDQQQCHDELERLLQFHADSLSTAVYTAKLELFLRNQSKLRTLPKFSEQEFTIFDQASVSTPNEESSMSNILPNDNMIDIAQKLEKKLMPECSDSEKKSTVAQTQQLAQDNSDSCSERVLKAMNEPSELEDALFDAANDINGRFDQFLCASIGELDQADSAVVLEMKHSVQELSFAALVRNLAHIVQLEMSGSSDLETELKAIIQENEFVAKLNESALVVEHELAADACPLEHDMIQIAKEVQEREFACVSMLERELCDSANDAIDAEIMEIAHQIAEKAISLAALTDSMEAELQDSAIDSEIENAVYSLSALSRLCNIVSDELSKSSEFETELTELIAQFHLSELFNVMIKALDKPENELITEMTTASFQKKADDVPLSYAQVVKKKEQDFNFRGVYDSLENFDSMSSKVMSELCKENETLDHSLTLAKTRRSIASAASGEEKAEYDEESLKNVEIESKLEDLEKPDNQVPGEALSVNEVVASNPTALVEPESFDGIESNVVHVESAAPHDVLVNANIISNDESDRVSEDIHIGESKENNLDIDVSATDAGDSTMSPDLSVKEHISDKDAIESTHLSQNENVVTEDEERLISEYSSSVSETESPKLVVAAADINGTARSNHVIGNDFDSEKQINSESKSPHSGESTLDGISTNKTRLSDEEVLPENSTVFKSLGDEQTDVQADEQIDVQANEQANEPTEEQADEQADVQADVQADEQADEQANEHTDVQRNEQADEHFTESTKEHLKNPKEISFSTITEPEDSVYEHKSSNLDSLVINAAKHKDTKVVGSSMPPSVVKQHAIPSSNLEIESKEKSGFLKVPLHARNSDIVENLRSINQLFSGEQKPEFVTPERSDSTVLQTKMSSNKEAQTVVKSTKTLDKTTMRGLQDPGLIVNADIPKRKVSLPLIADLPSSSEEALEPSKRLDGVRQQQAVEMSTSETPKPAEVVQKVVPLESVTTTMEMVPTTMKMVPTAMETVPTLAHGPVDANIVGGTPRGSFESSYDALNHFPKKSSTRPLSVYSVNMNPVPNTPPFNPANFGHTAAVDDNLVLPPHNMQRRPSNNFSAVRPQSMIVGFPSNMPVFDQFSAGAYNPYVHGNLAVNSPAAVAPPSFAFQMPQSHFGVSQMPQTQSAAPLGAYVSQQPPNNYFMANGYGGPQSVPPVPSSAGSSVADPVLQRSRNSAVLRRPRSVADITSAVHSRVQVHSPRLGGASSTEDITAHRFSIVSNGPTANQNSRENNVIVPAASSPALSIFGGRGSFSLTGSSNSGDTLRRPTFQNGVQAKTHILPPSVVSNIESLMHTMEQYRQNAKKSDDPAVQYNFGCFMVQAAQDVADVNVKAELLDEGYRYLKKLAHNGNPDAAYYIAKAYLDDQDYVRAFSYLEVAAKHGHVRGTLSLAQAYELGLGTRKDNGRAMQYYKKAASLDEPIAMTRIGRAYAYGHLGVKSNSREAMKWYKRAMVYNNPETFFEAAKLYQVGAKPYIHKDVPYAVSLYTEAAELGFAEAQMILGTAYEYGRLGLPIDPTSSIKWYLKAAESGNADAQCALAGWYLTGASSVLPQSDDLAYQWISRSAAQGLPKAEFAMGYFIEEGIGIAQNPVAALHWYEVAAKHGDKRAIAKLEGTLGVLPRTEIARKKSLLFHHPASSENDEGKESCRIM